jgi:hypothetical protein
MNLLKKKFISKFQKLEILYQKDKEKMIVFPFDWLFIFIRFWNIVLSENKNEKNKYTKKHIWLSIKVHFYIFCVFVYKPK